MGLIDPGFVAPSRVNSMGENGVTKFWINKFDTTTYLFYVTVTLAALYETKEDGPQLNNFELTLFAREIWSGKITLTFAFKAVTES